MRYLFYIIIFIIVAFGVLLFALNTPDIPREELLKKYANDASQFIEINGMEVHYRDEGQGFPLVLVHGTASSLHTWDIWTEELKDSLRIIRLDLPAFGLTGPHPSHDYRLDTYAQLVDELLLYLEVDSCYIAGNSLGGAIARKYAENYPQKTQKLLLIDPGGYRSNKGVPFAFKLGRTPIVKNIVSSVTPLFLFENSIKEVYHDDNKITEELLTRYYELTLAPGNRDALVARMNQDYKPTGWKENFLQIPVLIMWGKTDEWIPVSMVDSFMQDIPVADVLIYEDAGHVPMEEIPYRTAADARSFFLDKAPPLAEMP